MAKAPGQWLTLREYAERFGLPLAAVQKRVEAGELVKKRVDGLNYLWAGAGEKAVAEPAPAGPEPAAAVEPEPVATPEVQAPAASQEMALRTDRALSLVEKSLHTFMLMHREVVREKERLLLELQGRVREKEARLVELEKILRQREQELADLKMLAGLLEDQLRRARAPAGSGLAEEKERELGDLIQDQLSYLMEDQLVRELTKA